MLGGVDRVLSLGNNLQKAWLCAYVDVTSNLSNALVRQIQVRVGKAHRSTVRVTKQGGACMQMMSMDKTFNVAQQQAHD